VSPKEERIQLLHPDPDRKAPRVSAEKYEAVREAILQAVSENADGILFKDLAGRVSQLLTSQALDNLGSVGWYTTTVKLDLEARGLIQRVPGSKPQCLQKAH
jgi:hypothetical protein